jgi:hypothetical protein
LSNKPTACARKPSAKVLFANNNQKSQNQ